jgi:hypothetical protein
LHQKELDLERVRKEIQALLTVIPLLGDDPPSSDVLQEVPLALAQHTRILSRMISLNGNSTTLSSGIWECLSPKSGNSLLPTAEVPNDLWLCDDTPFSVHYISHARVM